MGFKTVYKCSSCSYEAFISAGADRGFLRYTNTYACLNCKILLDLALDKLDNDGKAEPYSILADEKCPNCFKAEFVLWDSILKPCPKCDGQMVKDQNGRKILWD